MANGRIDVYFHSSGEEGNGEEEKTEGQDGEQTSKKKSDKEKARDMLGAMALSNLKKGINYGVSMIGDLTGNYMLQNQLQDTISIGGELISMANFPVGTVAGVFSVTTQTISQVVNTNKANRQASILRARTGNETINNSEAD